MKRWGVGAMSLVIFGLGALLAPSSAWAGGWAVSTVDPMTSPVAGEATAIGFTIRQHGVRPVNPEGRIGIGIASGSGAEELFVATPRGATGHYIARVRFPKPGSYRWKIHQAWFGPQDLGLVDVVGAGTVATHVSSGGDTRSSGSTYRGPLSLRVLLPVLGIGFGVFAVAEAVRTRRRRSQELIVS